jgi:hypothetical protein
MNKILAKMRNVVAFYYEPKLTMRRSAKAGREVAEPFDNVLNRKRDVGMAFELGDLIVDEITSRSTRTFYWWDILMCRSFGGSEVR